MSKICYHLLDTEDLYTEAFQNIVSQYGKNYTFELKQKLMGSQSHETASTIISELGLPLTVEDFIQESEKEFRILFPDTELMPGELLCTISNTFIICNMRRTPMHEFLLVIISHGVKTQV